jgi:hypothetical protein
VHHHQAEHAFYMMSSDHIVIVLLLLLAQMPRCLWALTPASASSPTAMLLFDVF